MGKQVSVSGTFVVGWDTDQLRHDWDEPDMSDDEVLAECISSVQSEWEFYASTPDTIHVEGSLA